VSRERDGFQAILCRIVDECCLAETSEVWRMGILRHRGFVGFVYSCHS